MTTKIRAVLAAVFVGGIGAVHAAETYYVDDAMETDAGDGKSELTAKKYIQSAVDLCEDGDTVVILPGTYDSGEPTPSGAADSLPTRVKITKRITLTSRDGKDSVFICGKLSAETAYGAGSDAVRGIMVTAGGAGSLIERVTVRDGGTFATGSKGYDIYGGGIYCNDMNVYVCDCTISHCAASNGGGVYKGTLARCWLTRNSDNGGYASAAFYSRLSNCIVSHNPSSPYLFSHNDYIVNCTMVDNEGGPRTPRNVCAILNCISVDNKYDAFTGDGTPSSGYIGAGTNCVVHVASPKYDVSANIKKSCTIRQFVSPAADDYRLLPTSDAINYGNAQFLVERTSDLPEKYRYRDYFGNPIPTDGTPIHCGAVQTVVPVQATGFLALDASLEVKGHGACVRADSNYVSSDQWPAQVEVDYTGEGELLLYKDKSTSAFNSHVPKIGKTSAWITLPPTSVSTLSIVPVTAKQVVYADASADSDDYDGSAPTPQGGTVGPKRKLQDAIDAVTEDYALVKVAPGTYDEGGKSGTGELDSRIVIGRSAKYTFVRSTGSAADTFVVGAPDPDTKGLGPKACRCASLVSFGFLQGVTLTGGFTDYTGDDARKRGGGVYFASAAGDCSAIDCVISNNAAYAYAAACSGRIVRSLITENQNPSGQFGTLLTSTLISSVVRRMSANSYTIRTRSSLYNCTVVGRSSDRTNRMFEGNVYTYNCVVGRCGTYEVNSGLSSIGNALWDSTCVPAAGSYCSNVTLDPVFADEANLDYRPCELSGIEGVGTEGLPTSDAYLFLDSDFNGNPLFFKDGKMTPGALQTFCKGVVVSTTLANGLTVTGGTLGTNTLTETKPEIVLEATKTATRPFLGFRVDGEFLDRAITSLTLDASYANKKVETVYTTDWYVDANDGDDGADGMTPATARKTFEKAMELPFIDNDTLHALPGRYDRGSMKQPQDSHYWEGDGRVDLPSRLWINKRIKIVADGGPDVTFIVGESAPAGAADENGLGRGAMRCVVNSAVSTLKGFTLTGGRTLRAADVTAASDDDLGGGGYLSTIGGGNGVLWNCVITNCAAAIGAGIVQATARRCAFVDLTSTSGAIGAYVSFLRGSYFNHLRGSGPVLSFYRALESCTFGEDCRNGSGEQVDYGKPNNDGIDVINSIVLLPVSSTKTVFHDSVLVEGSGYAASLTTNCHFVATAEAAKLDADGVPIAGSGSPALGNGNRALYDESQCGTEDLHGHGLLSNNGFDIGAFQSDWRGYYARRIGGRTLACTAVSPTAYWTDGGLRLGDGDSAEFALKEPVTPGDPVVLRTQAAVSGTGTLTVETDAGAVDYTADDSPVSYETEFTSGVARHRFAFADQAGEGFALVSRLKKNSGMLLLVR